MSAVPLHPEATDDPSTILWRIAPADLLAAGIDFDGVVATAPGALGELIDAGVLELRVDAHGLIARLGDGWTWAADGGRVRTALSNALADRGWRGATVLDPDARLRRAVEAALAGPVGDYIASHGGRINLVSAYDGKVEVLMEGTCAGCPAAGVTLRDRLDAAIRERYPDLVSIAATEVPATSGTWLGSIGRKVWSK